MIFDMAKIEAQGMLQRTKAVQELPENNRVIVFFLAHSSIYGFHSPPVQILRHSKAAKPVLRSRNT